MNAERTKGTFVRSAGAAGFVAAAAMAPGLLSESAYTPARQEILLSPISQHEMILQGPLPSQELVDQQMAALRPYLLSETLSAKAPTDPETCLVSPACRPLRPDIQKPAVVEKAKSSFWQEIIASLEAHIDVKIPGVLASFFAILAGKKLRDVQKSRKFYRTNAEKLVSFEGRDENSIHITQLGADQHTASASEEFPNTEVIAIP